MKKIFSILESLNKLYEQDEIKLVNKFNFLDLTETAPNIAVPGMKMLILNAIIDIPFKGRSGLIPISNIVTDWVKRNEKILAPILWEKIREHLETKHPKWAGKGFVEEYKKTHISPLNQKQTEFFPEFLESNDLRIMLDLEIILEK